MGYVYKITNTLNNKTYIGISVNEPTQGRIRKHLAGHGNRIIANAVKKYGRDAFTYDILEANVFDEFLPDLEVAYIAKFNTVAPHGYNLTYGGDHAIPSKDARQKLSEAVKGKKNPNFGKVLSEEHRRKISEANKGKKRKPLSKEHRRKISEANKGTKNQFYGKRHSVEARRKMSDAHRGRKCPPLSEAHRRKISEAKRGKNHHNFGKKLPEEHRRKLHESRRLPEHALAHKFFLSLPSDMPLKAKRELLYTTFPSVSRRTIRSWILKWA